MQLYFSLKFKNEKIINMKTMHSSCDKMILRYGSINTNQLHRITFKFSVYFLSSF